ncbi:Imm1 family immunity protein [Conexibacter woesei]|uniref:Imm1 family immunity protein n=1 Tax=Conexibacter woesei TaxID=191495 RepID=UPI00047D9034|nr:Imm1 family immunity protein [Conexibacter woesei]
MHADEWSRNYEHGVDLVEPSIADVLGAVDKLDGNRRTLLVLQGEADFPELCVGGGSGGEYVVTFGGKSGVYSMLVGDPTATGNVSVTAGGQAGDVEARYIVNREHVRLVVDEFVRSGC